MLCMYCLSNLRHLFAQISNFFHNLHAFSNIDVIKSAKDDADKI